ncbi:MAG: hypothetical protein ABI615_14270, partial [Chthoniobacterales bacterium]
MVIRRKSRSVAKNVANEPSISSSPRRYALIAEKKADEGALAPAPPLPCLYNNNSIEKEAEEPSWNILGGNHRKTATLLGSHVEKMVSLYSLETIGFLTLSFADHVTDAREAGRRINSLLTNVIRKRYPDYIAVLERMKNKRIHYHLLVAVGADIRSGFDFAAVKRKDYRTASAQLRSEWAFWRRTAPKYRFGRTELMPIKSNK